MMSEPSGNCPSPPLSSPLPLERPRLPGVSDGHSINEALKILPCTTTPVHSSDNKSSSTEGPDSMPHSNSSSPLFQDIMIPAYPEAGQATLPEEEGEEEEEEGEKPLLPLFVVKFLDEISKDGDVVHYKLKVKNLFPNESKETIIIQREYDDFEYLHHELIIHNQVIGVIVPPLPPRPDGLSAENRSRKELGPVSGQGGRAILGDEYDVRGLEKFLHQLLYHPLFGRDETLKQFLWVSTPPVRARIKKGFLAGMKQTLDWSRKINTVKEADDFFQKEKEWALAYGRHLQEACQHHSSMMNAQLRLANQVSHLATLLNASVGGHEGSNAFYNRLNARFSTSLEQTEKTSSQKMARVEKAGLGDYLSHWSAYTEAENAMLDRRASLYLEFELAGKNLAKAKATKAHALRKTKDEKEKLLEEVSKQAERETRRFHHQRLTELKTTLVKYAEDQRQTALESCKVLSDCLLKIRDFPLPEVSPASLQRPQ